MKRQKAIVLLRGRDRVIGSLDGVDMLGNEFKL